MSDGERVEESTMKRCHYLRLAAALCVAMFAVNALAVDVNVKDDSNRTPGDPSDPSGLANCDLTGYKSETAIYNPPVAIPDNNPAGVTVGPLVIPDDGTLVGDVVIDLRLNHTWIGDIIANVSYDENCDGTIDVQTTVFCRPGRTGSCGTTGSGVGCSSNFLCDNILLFDDAATASLPTTGCLSATNVPAGCYRPTGINAGLLSVFEGHRKGGCWYLSLSDNASLDTGTLCQFSVHVLNTIPIGVAPSNWSNVKATYR
jgi:hypothetical protein